MDKVTMETPWGDRLSAGRRLKMAYVGRCGRKRFPGAEAPTVLSNVHRVTKYLRMQTYTDFLIPAELSEVSLQMRGPLSRKDWKTKGATPGLRLSSYPCDSYATGGSPKTCLR